MKLEFYNAISAVGVWLSIMDVEKGLTIAVLLSAVVLNVVKIFRDDK